MARLAPLVVVIGIAIFAIANGVNALYKGGDFAVFLEAGHRLIDGRPQYADSSPGNGVIGPPFQAVFFGPFARLARVHLPSAKIVWYVINLAALAAGVWLWALALLEWPASPRALLWHPVLWAVLAISLPAQTNFEHQNMNALLLGLMGAGAYALHTRSTTLAGLAFGAATALKAFPGLILIYLLLRREWRAAIVGSATAAVLTLLPAVRYGAPGMTMFWEWLVVNRGGGWPVRPQNQSVFAAAQRWFPNHGTEVAIGLTVTLVLATLLLAHRRRSSGPISGTEVAMVLAVSVMVSPIAWDHYWVLLFPIFLAAASWPGHHVAFLISATLVSGLSPALVGNEVFQLARSLSSSTAAGLVLVATAFSRLARLRN